MKLGIGLAILVVGYGLSQFYRSFLAVLTEVLARDTGAGPEDLAVSSGLWFVSFAVMQLPVGWGLDRLGPRRTVGWLFAIGGAGGAAVFALAVQPWHIHASMILLGAGCAPVLMGAYFILARGYPARVFGMLAGVIVGIGGLGNILGASPLVRATEAFGWRETMWGLTLFTAAVALAVLALVRDPPAEAGAAPSGSLRELLGIRALWWLLPVTGFNYACFAALRGVWAAPYLQEVFGADQRLVGHATLVMGLAMIAGSFAFGPIARVIGLRRTGLMGTAVSCVTLVVMWLWPDHSVTLAVWLLGAVGLGGANYAILMAHGRAFMPAHLVGRGITFLNMISLGGVGLLQFGSRPVYQALSGSGDAAHTFAMLFLLFLIPLTVALILYLLSPEAPDDVRR